MTNLHLVHTRQLFTEKTTISDATLNGKHFCYFLEDKDRGLKQSMPLTEIEKLKVYGVTAIPTGTYKIVITLSGTFGIWLPLVLDTPGYKGIREHIGNFDKDTLGCLLPGLAKGVDAVTQSTAAFEKLMTLYLNHLICNPTIVAQLLAFHKKGRAGAKEFGELFTKNLVKTQTITIEIK